MLRAQLNTVSNFLSDATTPESVFIVPTHDIVSDKMKCWCWRHRKYPEKGKYLGESDESFIVAAVVKIVSSWIQQIVHGVGIVKGESSAHCAGVRVSKRPSSCLTTLSSLLVPICQWTRFLDISYKQFLSKVMILAQRSTHKQLSTPDFFPPKDNPFACFITPWWCESVFRFPLSVTLWPVSLIRAKTGDNWWFGTKIVIYHFLLSHNWGAETDAESKYWWVHLLSLPVT